VVGKRQAPWLAPLVVPLEMKQRLEKMWRRLAQTLGTPVPKTMFVRMLLEKGLQAFEASFVMLDPNPRIAEMQARMMTFNEAERDEFERFVRSNYPEYFQKSQSPPRSRPRKKRRAPKDVA
jgi:hypothetical protein